MEHHCVAVATQPSISLGSRPDPPLPLSRDTELNACKAHKAGSYLWAMAQAHRVPAEFIQHQWREYPSITGVINYHLFRFMVPLSAHKKLQDEMVALKKIVAATQSEVSKISSKMNKK